MIGRVVGPLLVAALVIGSLPGEADAASDSAVRWSSYSESSQCGSPYVGTPVMSRSGSLADSERPFFQRQTSGARSQIDWSVEREWRHLGDVDLVNLPNDVAVLFVPSVEEARWLSSHSPWPIVVLD